MIPGHAYRFCDINLMRVKSKQWGFLLAFVHFAQIINIHSLCLKKEHFSMPASTKNSGTREVSKAE
jgi:hypothetical protein